MSTTVLGFHRLADTPPDDRPCFILERHGSLHRDDVEAVLNDLGFGLMIGPNAKTRLRQRDYAQTST